MAHRESPNAGASRLIGGDAAIRSRTIPKIAVWRGLECAARSAPAGGSRIGIPAYWLALPELICVTRSHANAAFMARLPTYLCRGREGDPRYPRFSNAIQTVIGDDAPDFEPTRTEEASLPRVLAILGRALFASEGLYAGLHYRARSWLAQTRFASATSRSSASASTPRRHTGWRKHSETHGVAPIFPMIGYPGLFREALWHAPAIAGPVRGPHAPTPTSSTFYVIGPDKNIKLVSPTDYAVALRRVQPRNAFAPHRQANLATPLTGSRELINAGSVSDEDAKKTIRRVEARTYIRSSRSRAEIRAHQNRADDRPKRRLIHWANLRGFHDLSDFL